jgi:hypothetical protein
MRVSIALLLTLSSICFCQEDTTKALLAYRLSALEESIFSVSDTNKSTFWSAWDSVGNLSLARLTCADASGQYGGRCARLLAATDVCVAAKAAYGARGVYLLFEVSDDTWVTYFDPTDIHGDAIELYMSPSSSRALYQYPESTFCGGGAANELTAGFAQLRFPCGDFIDDGSRNIDWGTAPACIWAQRSGILLRQAESEFGIVVKTGDGPVWDHKWIELLIPWRTWGAGGGVEHTPELGAKLGMTFGYNDSDNDDRPIVGLRWRGCDPFSNQFPAWGDLTIGDSLGNHAGAGPSGRSPERPAKGRRKSISKQR